MSLYKSLVVLLWNGEAQDQILKETSSVGDFKETVIMMRIIKSRYTCERDPLRPFKSL
jgi:hypothetical protein